MESFNETGFIFCNYQDFPFLPDMLVQNLHVDKESM